MRLQSVTAANMGWVLWNCGDMIGPKWALPLGLCLDLEHCVWFQVKVWAPKWAMPVFIFTPQPSGLEGHCHHSPGRRVGGCQTCGTHISVTAWQIFSIRSSVELSRPVVVRCHDHLPICLGLPMGQKLVKSGSTCARLCRSHISETAGWIYTIRSSMELSRPVVVQQHGHLTLNLDFQGQILKMLYLRNGRADWHGTEGMWVDRMLESHCDFELWPHPWPWPWIFRVNFWNSCISETGGPINMEWKG